MSEAPTVEDRVRRGEQARRLLEEPLIVEAFTALDRDYVQAWRLGRTVQERESAHMCIQALELLKQHLRSAINGGTIARQAVADHDINSQR